MVTAVDAVGNESLPSNSFYLNFDLLPISSLTLVREDNEKPQISWSHPASDLLRYEPSIKSQDQEIFDTSLLPDSTSFIDQGYTDDERTYTLVAVDQNSAKSMGRAITLPKLAFVPESFSIKRGIMNRVNVLVDNLSGKILNSLTASLTLNGREHTSTPMTLPVGASSIPVIVGGYSDLNDFQAASLTLDSIPNPGEKISIIRHHTMEVGDAMLKLTLFNEPFLRGGLGKIWFELENTGAAQIEIVTAQNSGTAPGQAGFFLEDTMDNVLSTASLQQALGDKVITLANKQTVARIPAGTSFICDPVEMFIPANAPDHVETGVAHEDIVTESITLSNKGLADLADVFLTLIDGTGKPAPDWVRLNTPADLSTLAVGDGREVSISFLPGSDTAQGSKVFYLSVTSSNYPATNIGLYPTITSSGIGNALFKLSDIYTGTFNAKNELIRGLADGKITLQNEATLSSHTATTDSLGQALFEDLTAGPYKCRITANAHQEYTGRVWIRPGITVGKEVFLEYNLVTVEWEVNEITIEDKYEIILSATFETDVPAPVVLAEPLSITLPNMEKGDVFLGEFTLINYGLIRADNLSIPVPKSDANFQYEILTGIPDSLEAKQRITIPYRITCLLSLDRDEEDDTGGGCYTYQKCMPITYYYYCANGQLSRGSTRHCFYKSGGSCGGSASGSGSTPSPTVISGGGGGGTSSPAPAYTPIISTDQKCLPKPGATECKSDTCKASGQNPGRHGQGDLVL